MEQQPEVESEFEEIDKRTVQWRTLGYSVISLYRRIEDNTMAVLVQDYHPKDGESYWVVPCAGHSVLDVYRQPWEY